MNVHPTDNNDEVSTDVVCPCGALRFATSSHPHPKSPRDISLSSLQSAPMTDVESPPFVTVRVKTGICGPVAERRGGTQGRVRGNALLDSR